jgi:hypothetical protein
MQQEKAVRIPGSHLTKFRNLAKEAEPGDPPAKIGLNLKVALIHRFRLEID